MGAKAETFGSPVTGYVTKQLEQRASLVESNSKTVEQQHAIHSNAAWVMLRSSVNQITDGEVKQLLQNRSARPNVTGTADLAKKYVLTGGTLNAGGDPRSGINLEPGSTTGNNAYTNQSLGFRPMPGITGLKCKTKNRFGTILQAEVDFVVWTVEDLENIEKLYFKPGYTCILEWGHSVYVDNSGNTAKMGADNFLVPDGHVFTPRSGTEMDNNIKVKREAGHGNYEGMFGYIQNYNWSFRPDGGYDCSLKIVSRGQILEAMKVGKTTDATKPEDKSEDADKVESKSVLHYVFTKLTHSGKTVKKAKELLKSKKAEKVANKLKTDFTVLRMKQDIARSAWYAFDDSVDFCVISLRSFFEVINATSVLLDNTKKLPLVTFNTDFGQKFITFPNHWSLDPYVANIPKTPSKDTDYCITRDDLTKEMEKLAPGDKADDCLSIFVSTNFIISQVDKIIGEAGTDEGAGIYDVVISVLKEVQRCLGNVNQFDLYSDPEFPDNFTMVDRNNLSPESIPVINVTGLKSTTKSLNISSKITSKISNMVAIAAQGNSGNYNENIQTLLQWNQGALDRHIRAKDQSDAEQDEEANERIEKHLEELDDVFTAFNGLGASDQQYDGEKWNQMENQNISYIQKGYKEHIVNNGKVPQGVIPIELSLKMLGISGLKPGLTFRINKGILPAKYDGYGFLVTGISHTLENNQWWTDIKTTFFPIKGSPKVATPSTGARASGGGGAPRSRDAAAMPTPEEIAGHTQANRLRQALIKADYKEKGQELSNGGDITKQTADLGIAIVEKVKTEVPGVSLIFTGGNDAFHHKLSYVSRHAKGRGLDFVITPYSTNNQKAVLKVLQGFAAGGVPNVKFIDEYSNPTRAASGKHFHVSWGAGTEGKKDVNRAVALASEGKITKYNV